MQQIEKININNLDAVVAKVINNYTVVINRGSKDGIKIGDRFLIYELTDDIKDPLDGRSLGPLELTKGTGMVINVDEKKATVQSDRRVTSAFINQLRQIEAAADPELLLIPFKDPKELDHAKRIN
jgi:hypothetical protein